MSNAITSHDVTAGRSSDRRPPPGFVEKLKKKDDQCEIVWSQTKQTWVLQRWTHGPHRLGKLTVIGPYLTNVATLRTHDGKYRELGDWVFDWMDAADSRGVNMEEFFARQYYLEQRAEEKEEEELDRYYKEHAMDRFRQSNSIVVDGFADAKPVEPMFGGGA